MTTLLWALMMISPSLASSQIYVGAGISVTPGKKAPIAALIQASGLEAPGNAINTGEFGGFVQLRIAAIKHSTITVGLAGGFANVERSDGPHVANTQIGGELGVALGLTQAGLHVGVTATQEVVPDQGIAAGLRGRLVWNPKRLRLGADLFGQLPVRAQSFLL